jgi:hypothetical protein
MHNFSMVVKKLITDGGDKLDRSKIEQSEMGEGGRSDVWYGFPESRGIKASGPLKLHLESRTYRAKVIIKKGALLKIDEIIEDKGMISEREVFKIFRETARPYNEEITEGSIKNVINKLLRSGGWVRMRETPDGFTPDYSMINRIAEKIENLWGVRGAEERALMRGLQKKFDMDEKEALGVVNYYRKMDRSVYYKEGSSTKRLEILMSLATMMPDASFNALDMLMRNQYPFELSKMEEELKKPAGLREFLGRANSNMIWYLKQRMPNVSEEALKDFVSKTPINELAEKINVLRKKREECKNFSDDDLARFRLEEKEGIAVRERREWLEAIAALQSVMHTDPLKTMEKDVGRIQPERIKKNVAILKDKKLKLGDIGGVKAIKEMPPYDFKIFCEEQIARKRKSVESSG